MNHSNRIPKWITNLTETDIKDLLVSDKEIMRQFARWISEPNKVTALQQEITRLSQENLRLRTVMVAAHEEITEFWDAHCDADGYGPQNLVRHLKEGTGYYPGYVDRVTFSSLDKKTQQSDNVDLGSNIPGLTDITEEKEDDGGTRFIFHIEDDKIDAFYAAFGLKTGDEEGFQRVAIEAIKNKINILKKEEVTTGEP